MCGLVGVAGTISAKDEKVFKNLLVLDQLRGEHSTGILSVTSTYSTEVLKKMGGHAELKQYKQYDEIFRKCHRVLMGHNRWATQGAVNHVNAHPFEFKTIIGAHNGTLRNKHALPDAKNFEVDSENLYHAIEKDGLEASIKITNGAYALTWWNKDEKSLNFLRNSERPLHFCHSEDGKVLYWASEPWMLRVALERNTVKHGEIYSLKEMAHWSISFEGYKASDKVPTGVVKQIKPYVAPVTHFPAKKPQGRKGPYLTGDVIEFNVSGFSAKGVKGTGGDYLICSSTQHLGKEFRIYTHKGSDLWDMLWGGGTERTYSARVTSYAPNGSSPYYRLNNNTIVESGGSYVGHQGKKLSKEEWEEAVGAGCSMCASPITHPSQVADWFSDDSPICTDCQEDFIKLWNYN